MSYKIHHRGFGALDKGTVSDIHTGIDIGTGIARGIVGVVREAEGGGGSSTPIPDPVPLPTSSSGPSTDWTPWIIGGGAVAVLAIGILVARAPRAKKVAANRRRRGQPRRYEVVSARDRYSQRVESRHTSRKAARKAAIRRATKSPDRTVVVLDRGKPVLTFEKHRARRA